MGILFDIIIFITVFFQKFNFFVGQEFIKDKSQNIVLIFICFNLGTHSVGGFPDFICQLLFIHKGVLRSIVISALSGVSVYHYCLSFAFSTCV